MSESISTIGSASVTKRGNSTLPKCLIACSGSVATLKIPELVAELHEYCEVMILCTTSAAFFFEKAQFYNEQAWQRFQLAGGMSLILKDEDEWHMWNTIGNSILHIEMRRWADILVVAPASANLLSKSAFGISDNFVLSVMRAWDFTKPCVVCPAMNTAMWTHPTTRESLTRLRSFGYDILGPVEKVLACGDKGNGAMIGVQEIKAYVLAKVNQESSPDGILTHELTNTNLHLNNLLLNSSMQFSDESGIFEPSRLEGKAGGSIITQTVHYKQTPSTGKELDSSKVSLQHPIPSSSMIAGGTIATHPEPTVVAIPSPETAVVKAHNVSLTTASAGSTQWLMTVFALGLGIGVGTVLPRLWETVFADFRIATWLPSSWRLKK